MTSARIRYEVAFCPESQREDLPEMNSFCVQCQESFQEALETVRAWPEDGTPKGGRLVGTLSVSFWDGLPGKRLKGRIVYSVRQRYITIWSAHPDHDEAYKRAQVRYKSALRRR